MNSKQKGNRAEREVVKILNDFYKTNIFERVPSSGARATTSKNLTEHKANVMIADIIVPENFPFFIETKFYKNEPDLWKLFETGLFPDGWEKERTEQTKQIEVTKKEGIILVFRANKRGYLAMLEQDIYNDFSGEEYPSQYILTCDRVIMSLANMLTYLNCYTTAEREKFKQDELDKYMSEVKNEES